MLIELVDRRHCSGRERARTAVTQGEFRGAVRIAARASEGLHNRRLRCEDAAMTPAGPPPPRSLRGRHRLRRVVNAVTLGTPLGLALARTGRATVVRGPDGLLLALDYRSRVPAPRAPAVTVGDVVLLRMDADELARRPLLLQHEGRHAVQWACWLGPLLFVPAYLLASVWSWLLCRDFALRNVFEVRAGLVAGGYAPPASPPANAPPRDPRV